MADDARIQIAVDRKRQRARDGRRRHNEQIGTGPLGAQGVTLAHAKAVLLVDDDERQMIESHVVRKDRVRTKEHVELTGLELSVDLFALSRRGGARQQCPRHTDLREQRASLVGILTCQHARRRHDTGLGAAIGSHGQRAGGNGRLAGADVAQQQTVHHALAIAHVMQDVLECSLLLVTQRER